MGYVLNRKKKEESQSLSRLCATFQTEFGPRAVSELEVMVVHGLLPKTGKLAGVFLPCNRRRAGEWMSRLDSLFFLFEIARFREVRQKKREPLCPSDCLCGQPRVR